MKNKKLTLTAGLMLVIAMLFSSFSVAAVDGDAVPTTPTHPVSTEVVSTTVLPESEETTNVPVDVPATAPTTELTTIPTTETTTGYDGYYDNGDYETDEEKDAYDDGYWDGYYDGYEDAMNEYKDKDYDDGYDDGYDNGYYEGEWDGYGQGYYEGYYDAVQDMEDKEVITVFDRWDAFIEDLRYRLEEFIYEIRDFFERIFKVGDYAPIEPNEPDNTDFVPDGSQATLAGDEAAAALCAEFNALIDSFTDSVPDNVTITKIADVGAEITDCPGGDTVSSIVQPILDNFTGTSTYESYYAKGDYTYNVQDTNLYPAGLTVAEKTVNEDGTTDYRFVLIEEAAYYDGYDTYGVKLVDGKIVKCTLQHEYAADALYIEYADTEPATITSAEIVYPGATVTATTDAKGRLVKYDVNMPVKGYGTGKISLITVTIGLAGYRNEGFTMEYDS